MNLHGLVAGAIGGINPFITGTIKVSDGTYTTTDDGRRTPSYTSAEDVSMQIQPLSSDDLRKLEGLNLQGEHRKIYFYGKYAGVIRNSQNSGDLVIISSGVNVGTWLVNQVLEAWPDWCCVAVTLQNE